MSDVYDGATGVPATAYLIVSDAGGAEPTGTNAISTGCKTLAGSLTIQALPPLFRYPAPGTK